MIRPPCLACHDADEAQFRGCEFAQKASGRACEHEARACRRPPPHPEVTRAGAMTRPLRRHNSSVRTSVEAQDRFLDLLAAAGREVAVDANASEAGFLQYSKRPDVVRSRSSVQWTFGSLGKKNLQCRARDAFPP